jgi:hypothetical protein
MPELYQLTLKYDIVFLQETWLLDFEVTMLSNVNNEFYAKGISSIDSSNDIVQGRPHGGMGILWRKALGNTCKYVDLSDERLMAIEITSNDKSILLLNIYMPYDCDDNVDEFLLYLSKVDSIVEDHSTPYVLCFGDFNANLIKDHYNKLHKRFGVELDNFCLALGLVISDYRLMCNTDVFTFVSEAHNTVSWLDHIVSTVSGHSLIQQVNIEYDFVTSDHKPIGAVLSLKNVRIEIQNDKNDIQGITWHELSADCILQYSNNTEMLLSQMRIDNDTLSCNNVNCTNDDHVEGLDKMYTEMTSLLLNASANMRKSNSNNCSNIKIVPGWNEYCAEAHAQARESFLLWVANGKPRYGVMYNMMSTTRAHFKRCLRWCKKNESKARADSLAKKFMNKDAKSVWREIKKINTGCHVISDTVNGATGADNIACKWKDYYQDLLNSNTDDNTRSFLETSVHNLGDNESVTFDYLEVKDAIKNLKPGKAPGCDCLSSEHFKYASDRLSVLLSLIFNCMIIHGVIPKSLMKTILVPVIKDKKGDITDMDNYRPIALTTVTSKLLEILILERFSSQLNCSSNNQHGFKAHHSTDTCVFIFKQIVQYYKDLSSPVYVCFLDASKAFDRVNHYKLFQKLLTKLPKIIVRLLMYWYAMQDCIIRWGGSYSTSFKVSNGVRQGGILSPILFNLYIDDLSVALHGVDAGCNLNGVCLNHLIYADDTVLLAPSPTGLQKLITICEKFAVEHSIIYNVKKTSCMCFLPKCLSKLHVVQVKLNGRLLKYVDVQKYLGIVINQDFNDDNDICRQMRAIYCRGNTLVKRFSCCTPDVKNSLFQSYCSNLYGAHLWYNFHKNILNKTKVAYNNVFRFLHKLPRSGSISQAMVSCKILTFNELLRKACTSFIQRLSTTENTCVNAIFNSLWFCTSQLNKRWNNLAFMLSTSV